MAATVRSAYSCLPTGRRCSFFSPRRRFSCIRRSTAALGRRVGTRGRRLRARLQRRSRNISSASCLFRNWLRSFWQVTTMPVGRWRRRTAVSRRLTFWPPGPLLRKVSTSHSASNSSSVLSAAMWCNSHPAPRFGKFIASVNMPNSERPGRCAGERRWSA